MRVVITADLHYPITPMVTLERMVADIEKEAMPDVMVLAGDLGETRMSARFFGECLYLFTRSFPNIPILVLAGNHDLWVQPGSEPGWDSEYFWKTALRETTYRLGGMWLEDGNYFQDGVAFAGSYLHYDYSSKDPSLVISDDQYMETKSEYNNDGRYLVGLPPDKVFAADIGSKFRQRLSESCSDNKVNRIIVVTHVPPVKENITWRSNDVGWARGTAYFGNLSSEQAILGCHKVTHVVSGHSHVAQRTIINRSRFNMDNVVAINLGSNYERPSYEVLDI